MQIYTFLSLDMNFILYFYNFPALNNLKFLRYAGYYLSGGCWLR